MYCYLMFHSIGTSQESFCLSNVFTLTTYYFDGARLCNCDLTGSITLQCEQFGGQCQCKSGAGGRTCDMCLPEYYAFRSTGCTCKFYIFWPPPLLEDAISFDCKSYKNHCKLLPLNWCVHLACPGQPRCAHPGEPLTRDISSSASGVPGQ